MCPENDKLVCQNGDELELHGLIHIFGLGMSGCVCRDGKMPICETTKKEPKCPGFAGVQHRDLPEYLKSCKVGEE